MKALFIVQGEGRGHLTQALTLEKALRKDGHEVVEVLVGKSRHRQLPDFFRRKMGAPIRQFESPNFLPTADNRRSKVVRSVAYNLSRMHRYARSVRFINKRIRKSGADVVVNFYELLTGITYLVYRPAVPQVSIGHQYLFLHDGYRFPEMSRASLLSLRLFTMITSLGAYERLALSFRQMADDDRHKVHVVPPLLRDDVLCCRAADGGYLHGYMLNAGFGETIMKWHDKHPNVPLNFFWDKQGMGDVYKVDDTLTFNYLDDNRFIQSMAHCTAYATTAGFESVCEAMYLGKPIMMVPAHIEQDCNAYDASRCGAGIISDDFDIDRLLAFAAHYRPDPSFAYWARTGSSNIAAAVERVALRAN